MASSGGHIRSIVRDWRHLESLVVTNPPGYGKGVLPMVTAKVAPEHHLALAQAASRHASAAHALGRPVLWLAVIGLAAAWFAVYRVSLWLHPFTLCRRCGGSGITAGFLPWSRAFCRKCDGRGLVPRLGTMTAGLWGRYPR
jgi:hypothetical protein